MKITFISNYLNHHQLPFCLELQKKFGDNFKFVATTKISEERLALGYDDMNKLYDFVVRAYESVEEVYKLAEESDIVIIGSAPSKYIKERLKKGKLTFRYSERLYKEGFNLKVWLAIIKNFTFLERKNTYLLCSSAYTANDFNKSFAYLNKCFKWGYFPEVKEYDIDKLIENKSKNKKIQILWTGRVIPYKHPEKAVEVAKMLKEKGYNFKLTMVGIGTMFEEIKDLVNKYDLKDEVELTGAINNKRVREYMEKANIFLFTSDYGEGWGSVLNEAMNSGCAVIASHAIGSVPFMIENNKSGLIYNNESMDDLFNKVEELVSDKKKMAKYGKNAYNVVIKYWNASYACEELLKLAKKLLNKEKNISLNRVGPCSKAESISNKKMYKRIMES